MTRTGGSGDDSGEAALARLYRAGATEAPPARLDADILARARAEAEAPRTAFPRMRRWAVPASLAATLLVSAGVAWWLWDRVAVDSVPAPAAPTVLLERSAADAARERPAPSAEARARAESARAPQRAPEAGAAALAAAKRPDAAYADVVSVSVSGRAGAYQFTVGVRSRETGCAQYADWWEVVGTDGKLLYRRVLLHSHVDEQPFVRSGGPVPIDADAVVWVRAHMNTTGYGGMAFKGSVAQGFRPAPLAPDFAASLADQPPLPERCVF